MLKMAQVIILLGHESAARALAGDKDTQIGQLGDGRTTMTSKCDDMGRISPSAQGLFEALFAAGHLACVTENPHQLELQAGPGNAVRIYGV